MPYIKKEMEKMSPEEKRKFAAQLTNNALNLEIDARYALQQLTDDELIDMHNTGDVDVRITRDAIRSRIKISRRRIEKLRAAEKSQEVNTVIIGEIKEKLV